MRLLNKNTARRAAAAAALLTMSAAMSMGAFAADAEDATVAGYLPPQSSEVMVQGDIALHSDVPVGEVDPNYGGGQPHSGQRDDDLRRDPPAL